MNKESLLILLAALTLSCNNPKNDESNSVTNSDSVIKQTTDKVADEKHLNIKNYYGTWINDSLYLEMFKSNSPCRSNPFIYNIRRLELNDSSSFFSYSEGLDYVLDHSKDDIYFLKCTDNPDYSIQLSVINDSTIRCTDPFDNKQIIMRKFKYYTNDFMKCNHEDPFLYYIKKIYFKGKKNVIVKENTKGNFVANFISSCTVTNFLDYQSYDIFNGGSEGTPEMNIITFETKGKNNYYNFEISNDSIFLYQFKTRENRMINDSLYSELAKGDLVYILTPQR